MSIMSMNELDAKSTSFITHGTCATCVVIICFLKIAGTVRVKVRSSSIRYHGCEAHTVMKLLVYKIICVPEVSEASRYGYVLCAPVEQVPRVWLDKVYGFATSERVSILCRCTMDPPTYILTAGSK